MRSFKDYTNDRLNYYNSLSFQTDNPIPCNEEELFIKHGANIDSIFFKMNVYNSRLKNPNFIHESYQDVLFNVEESFNFLPDFLASTLSLTIFSCSVLVSFLSLFFKTSV